MDKTYFSKIVENLEKINETQSENIKKAASLMADAIDYNEWKTGKREEGTVYSLHSFFRKLAQGIGPSVILLVMGALGYVSELGTEAQTAATALNMCWLVAALYMFSAVVQFIGLALIFNLDKKTLAQMTEELAARKQAQ